MIISLLTITNIKLICLEIQLWKWKEIPFPWLASIYEGKKHSPKDPLWKLKHLVTQLVICVTSCYKNMSLRLPLLLMVKLKLPPFRRGNFISGFQTSFQSLWSSREEMEGGQRKSSYFFRKSISNFNFSLSVLLRGYHVRIRLKKECHN